MLTDHQSLTTHARHVRGADAFMAQDADMQAIEQRETAVDEYGNVDVVQALMEDEHIALVAVMEDRTFA